MENLTNKDMKLLEEEFRNNLEKLDLEEQEFRERAAKAAEDRYLFQCPRLRIDQEGFRGIRIPGKNSAWFLKPQEGFDLEKLGELLSKDNIKKYDPGELDEIYNKIINEELTKIFKKQTFFAEGYTKTEDWINLDDVPINTEFMEHICREMIDFNRELEALRNISNNIRLDKLILQKTVEFEREKMQDRKETMMKEKEIICRRLYLRRWNLMNKLCCYKEKSVYEIILKNADDFEEVDWPEFPKEYDELASPFSNGS